MAGTSPAMTLNLPADLLRAPNSGANSYSYKRPGFFRFLAIDVYNPMTTFTEVARMRTNIEIDDELLSQAMRATGLPTKRATVEEGLRLLVRLRKQVEALADLKGLGWEGDLDEMRKGRRFERP
jgi:Arc/MetJ family transcription regulator